jgi:hypothetical protein
MAEEIQIKDIATLETYLKNCQDIREQTYKELTDLLDSGASTFDYIKLISVLDWLNAQTILGVMKVGGQWNCLRAVDILSNSTKKLIKEMYK